MSGLPDGPAPKGSRTIMLMFPLRGVKPRAIKVDFRVLPGRRARLHYEERFDRPERNVFALTARAVPKLFGNMFPTMKTFSREKTRTVGFDVEDDISKVAGYVMTEFMIQAFKEEDPTGEFWNMVDGLQKAFSTVHVNIWPQIPPQPPPLSILCGKCAKGFVVSKPTEQVVCPHCGHRAAPKKSSEAVIGGFY